MAFDQSERLVVHRLDIADGGEIATNVPINGKITTVDSVQFDTGYTGGSIGAGELAWNNTDGTLEFKLKGGNVTLQVGQEQVIRVRNSTQNSLTDGQVVYTTGSTGTFQTVALAKGDAEDTSSVTMAVVTESIAKNTEGFATTFGLVRDLNTSALTEGAIVWLSSTVAGGMTTTKPVAPAHAVQIGFCIRSHPNQGVVFVRIQNGYELEELHNVKITNPTDGQFLKYQASTGLWINSN